MFTEVSGFRGVHHTMFNRPDSLWVWLKSAGPWCARPCEARGDEIIHNFIIYFSVGLFCGFVLAVFSGWRDIDDCDSERNNDAAGKSMLQDVLHGAFRGDPCLLLSNLLDEEALSDRELCELLTLIEQRRREHGRG